MPQSDLSNLSTLSPNPPVSNPPSSNSPFPTSNDPARNASSITDAGGQKPTANLPTPAGFHPATINISNTAPITPQQPDIKSQQTSKQMISIKDNQTNTKPSTINPNISSANHKQQTINQRPTSKSLPRRLIPFLLPPLVVTTLILSFYFYTNQRQPQTSSRASNIKPTSSLLPTAGNIQPSTNQKSSGFGSLISTPDPSSPQPTTYLPAEAQALTGNLQPTTHLPAEASAKAGDLQPSTNISQPTTNNQQPTVPPQPTAPPIRVSYEIKMENNTFTPDKVEAKVGQIVALYFSAVDKTYDISVSRLNLTQTVVKGNRLSMEFQAPVSGEFTYQCNVNCENSPTARGTITINP